MTRLFAPVPRTCPRCSGETLQRVKTDSGLARLRKQFSSKRPFQCRTRGCGWRGWLLPLESLDAAFAPAAPAPNLGAIDRELANTNTPAGRAGGAERDPFQ